MKQSLTSLVRALWVLLLFIPAPLSVVGTPAAVADSGAQTVAAEPAVVVPEEAEEDSEDPWTARFLAPLVLVIGVVTIGASAAYYVIRIKGRYRTV
jgi:hypothetical protein